MLNFYKKYQLLFKNTFKNQNDKINLIATSITRSKEVIYSNEDEIEKNKPLKSEKESQIEVKKSEISEKKKNNYNLLQLNLEDEKPLTQRKIELNSVNDEIESFLIDYRDNIGIYEKSIKKLEYNDLILIRNTNENMSVAKLVIGQLYSLAGESSDWEFFKKNTDIKIIKHAIDFDYKNLDPVKVKIIKDTVKSNEFVYDNLKDAIYKNGK